jgi:uncharacterized protein YjiS (DUF1127 family)
MNGFVSRHPAALALEALSHALAAGARVARRTAAGLDRWLAHRQRALTDLDVLAGMSSRELADIGVDRASVSAVAAGVWQRDR